MLFRSSSISADSVSPLASSRSLRDSRSGWRDGGVGELGAGVAAPASPEVSVGAADVAPA